jgi:hypothetical protein
MEKISIIELAIAIVVVLAAIVVFFIALKKLFKSKLSLAQKIVWTLVIFGINVFGLVAFLIYHDYYLSPDRRGYI